MKTANRSGEGFSLLEILVVIGIIMVLVGLMSISFSTAQKKSRDAKIKSDTRAIQNAMEQYYSICGYKYPTPHTGSKVLNVFCPAPSAGIMPTTAVPLDAKSGASYTYSGDGSYYTICSPNSPPLETESVATYCLNNQQ